MTLPALVRRLVPALLIALALLSAPVAARGLKDYQRTVWTQQHGAPTDITALAQTVDGWLWVGSGDGLARFDGVNFEPYTPPGQPAFAHRRVIEMYAADNGDLYVVYFPIGVAVIRPDGGFRLLPEPTGQRRTPPLAMVVDGDNSLWTIGDGIRRFAGGRWTTVDSGPDWTKDTFYSMLLDQDGRLWAAAPNGTWRLDRARGRFDKVADLGGGLALAPNGDVWLLGDDGGPSRRIAASLSGKPRPPRAGAVVSRGAGHFAADGTLWALGCPETACLVHDATRGTALHPRREADERVPSAEGAAGQEFTSIIEDREGNLWIRAANGLNQFRPKRFIVPGLDLGDFFYTVAADGAGRVWVAETGSGKLWRIGPDGVPVAQPGGPVYLVANGRDGTVWKADRRTIARTVGDTVETIPLPPGPDGKPVDRQLMGLLDDGKRLWTMAMDTGPIVWSEGRWRPTAELGLPNGNIMARVAGPGQLWLASVKRELILYDNGKLTRYDGSVAGSATGIFPDRRVVLAGLDGLAVLKDGTLQPVRGADPDALRGVSGIAVTANGDRWLNGMKGVVHVRATDWQQALDRPGEPLRYELFGVSDGYPGRSGTSRRTTTAYSADGRHVWFVATKGIVGLDSRDLRRNGAPPRPFVMEVATDQARFDAIGSLRLPPGSQSFRVRFAAPSLRQPEHTRFEFRLDGFETGWRDAGNRRTTSYTNVAPGDYVFRVRAFNEDGTASTADAAVPITIEPTWTQTVPFKLALAAGLAAVLALLYRLRIRYLTRRITERIEIRMTERERIARTLHDTFLQTVYLLLMRLRKFEAKLPEPGARQELQAILEEARGVMDEGRDQVHELRATAPRTLDDIVRDCAASLRALHPAIQVELRCHGTVPDLDRAVLDEAGAIACEAVRNAFTHAQARNIVAEIHYGARELLVTVHDDGKGIAPEIVSAGARDGHWGLVGMRERAARIGAWLDIRSTPAGGTTVSLAVPLEQAEATRAGAR